MIAFLEEYKRRTRGTGDLPNLLADLYIMKDGGSSDPAALGDWEICGVGAGGGNRAVAPRGGGLPARGLVSNLVA